MFRIYLQYSEHWRENSLPVPNQLQFHPLASVKQTFQLLFPKVKIKSNTNTNTKFLDHIVIIREWTQDILMFSGINQTLKFCQLVPTLRQNELFSMDLIEPLAQKSKVFIIEDDISPIPISISKAVKSPRVKILDDE